MSYTLDNVIDRVSTVLHDTGTAIWGTAEIAEVVTDGLREIATYSPRVTLATVTPPEGTADLDISGTAFADLLFGRREDSFETVEFKIDKEPKRFRNFKVHKNTLTFDISFEPDGTDTARLYCYEPHILGGAGTTSLSPEMERLLVDLAAARLAINYGINVVNTVTKGGSKTFGEYASWGERKLGHVIRGLKMLVQPQSHVRWPVVD